MRIRQFILIRRKTGSDWPSFAKRWRYSHAARLATDSEFWELVGEYVQDHVRPAVPGFSSDPLFDGVAEYRQKPHRNGDFARSAYYREMVEPDLRAFVDFDRSVTLTAEEKVIVDGPRQGMKLLILAKRAPSLTIDEFQRYWFEEHGEKVREQGDFADYLKRYVQHHVRRSADGEEDPYCDGIVELWFDNVTAAIAAFSSPSYLEALRADERSFVADPPSPRLAVDEIVVSPAESVARQ